MIGLKATKAQTKMYDTMWTHPHPSRVHTKSGSAIVTTKSEIKDLIMK